MNLRFPTSLPDFQRFFPDEEHCAKYLMSSLQHRRDLLQSPGAALEVGGVTSTPPIPDRDRYGRL